MSHSDPLMKCIPPNPDITGIGIRVAIYAQNLLSFVPAIYALYDQEVSPTELSQLETQSSTILITAFAILLSTVIQGLANNLTPYHAAVVLNLSWMNNTSLCIYFLLYFYRETSIFRKENRRWSDTVISTNGKRHPLWFKQLIKALGQPVLWIGSAHLTLMAIIGIWLWRKPADFGNSNTCSLSSVISILGGEVQFSASGLRDWSIFIYSLLLTPFLNLILPLILFAMPFCIYKQMISNSSNSGIWPVRVGLGMLAIINAILLADTETAITKNKPLLEEGDEQWTFGQTLALLLLLLPARDIVEAIYERRAKELGVKLLHASRQGDVGVMQDAIKSGAPKIILDEALHIATQYDYPNAVTTLIDAGVSQEAKYSAMFRAVQEGQLVIVKSLADRGGVPIDTKGLSLNHWSLLYLAAKSNDRDTFQILVNGHDVNEKGPDGETVLHWVALEKSINTDIVRVLLGHADINAMDYSSYTALHYAVKEGLTDIVELFLEHHANVNIECSESILLSAVKSNNFDMTKFIIGKGADVNVKASNEKTPLHVAVESGNLDIVKFLLDKGADIHSNKAPYEDNPLYSAAKCGYFDIVKLLIDRGADIYAKSSDGRIPLHSAVEGGNLEIARLLLEKGADVHVQCYYEGTPLHFAAGHGNFDIVKLLLDKGADVHTQTFHDKKTPLHSAAEGGNLDIFRLFLAKGADIHAQRMIHFAAKGGNLDIFEFLCNEGVDVHAKTPDQKTSLHFAVEGGNLDIVRLLLSKGADIHAPFMMELMKLHSTLQSNMGSLI
ncbi:hypothetical protein C0995_001097 [Termitomyces sp. Mi166|nr:hypothetical protein C0995_001097 [Termitomyces sp. Mi166\